MVGMYPHILLLIYDLARKDVLQSRIENEIVESKQYLIDNGFSKGVEHFAYPFGTFDNDLYHGIGKTAL